MQQSFELIPSYYGNNGQPQMVFDNAKVTPTVFIQDNAKDIAVAKKIEAAVGKLGSFHRPLVFMATLFHTSDPTQALKEIAGINASLHPMILAGDPNLYPTTTPALVYWDVKAGKFQTVTDANQIVKMIPGLLNLSQGGSKAK